MEINNEPRPRRNLTSLVIDPFKQIKFGLYVIGISLGFIAIAAGLFVVAFTEQYRHVMNIFNIIDPNQQWELVTNDVFKTNAIRIGLVFIMYIVVMFLVVFRLTHRYYGPLVSIERFVEYMCLGEYHRRLGIRDRDELQSLVVKLNSMAALLEKRHSSEGSEHKQEKSDKAAS
jgi:uncharacterized protein YacL